MGSWEEDHRGPGPRTAMHCEGDPGHLAGRRRVAHAPPQCTPRKGVTLEGCPAPPLRAEQPHTSLGVLRGLTPSFVLRRKDSQTCVLHVQLQPNAHGSFCGSDGSRSPCWPVSPTRRHSVHERTLRARPRVPTVSAAPGSRRLLPRPGPLLSPRGPDSCVWRMA